MQLYIDIGGTNLRSELHDENRVIQNSIPSADTELVSYIEEQLQQYKDITFIAISYAGQVRDGKIISAPNIAVGEKDIKSFFEQKYNVTLEIENDLNCAAIAEADHFKEKNLVAIYIGTGIGCGYIENGKLVHSSLNLVGELGHIPYKKAPFRCGCGKDNCIELFASGSALQKHSNIDNVKLADLKEKKSEIAVEFEKALLFACATAIALFNPKMVVLGGGVVEKNDYLVEFIKENIKEYAPPFSLEGLLIKKSEITNATLKGASLLQI